MLLALFLYLQKLALNVCFVQQKASAPYLPPPRGISLGRSWDSFAIHPSHPGMASACFSFLCLDLAKSPPCRKDLHKHLLEWWGCCCLGIHPCSGHSLLPALAQPHSCTPQAGDSRNCASHTQGPRPLQLPQTEEQRRHTYT